MREARSRFGRESSTSTSTILDSGYPPHIMDTLLSIMDLVLVYVSSIDMNGQPSGLE